MILATLACLAAMKHTFTLGKQDFLLDDKPFQIRAGELHPARIPAEYWRHRIQMAKAMGLNTVSAYIFWNYLEQEEGKFDLTTGNRNVAQFLKLCQEEGMWVILRPGPYVCAEWDLGGLPWWLLKTSDIKVRCMDPRYTRAAGRYIARLAKEVKPLLVTKGGPILMVQVENEYGSFGNDRQYMQWVHDQWVKNGIDVPFYTSDGPTPYMLEAGSLPGCAVGLDSLGSAEDVALARKMRPGVPVFSGETYPGWLTHWGEKWAGNPTDSVVKEVSFLLENKHSFSLYMFHGGTNFEYWAGANSGGKGYEPDVTSYDYDAPLDEQGNATTKYMALRDLLGKHLPEGETLPAVPAPVPTVEIQPVAMKPYSSVWDNLPAPTQHAQPTTFEAAGLRGGLMLYRTKLVGHKSGKLTVTSLHDFATVFVDGQFVGTIDRREGQSSIDLPKAASDTPVLEILVEGMGRINFAQNLIDRKGITDRVTLNGMTLMTWEQFALQLDGDWVGKLKPSIDKRPGHFFRGWFDLAKAGDTYLDVSGYKKGFVWVNGHNLGRFWEIGPQKRLYCPGTWLKAGQNEVVVLDLLGNEAAVISGKGTLKE